MSGWRLALALLTAAAIGAVGGAWFVRPAPADGDDHRTAAADVGKQAREAAAPAAPGSGAGTGDAGFEAQRARAVQDPAYLQQLLQRYASAMDEDTRGAALALLMAVANDDVLRFALGMAASGDPEQRRRGLAVLAAFPLDRAEVRDTVVHGLAEERDPRTLAQLVELAAPSVMPSEDAAPIVRQLRQLATHPDPEVRARSVVQFAQWSDPEAAESALSGALVDDSPAVRRAAVGGIIATRARSDRLKDGLLWLAADDTSSAEDRNAALFALQWFALDRDEYALYREAAAAADGAGHGH